MKLLTFLAKRFRWAAYSQTLDDAPAPGPATEVTDAVVVYLHIEAHDMGEARARAFKKTLKHIKWLANKRDLKNVVLHSFTHLGGENAAPDSALPFMEDLRDRLETTGYTVWITPFGYFSEWDLSVHGESLAKVWKAF